MVFEKHTQWLTAHEYQSLRPLNVFAREGAELSENDGMPQNVHMYARRTFRVGKHIHSASLLISADDYYKLWINGKYVAQGPAPGYPSAYYVNRIDIMKYLNAGENVIALDVYYQGLINRVWVSGDRRMGFICELRVDDKVIVRSDERFRYMLSKSYRAAETSGYKTRFLENFDAREEPWGWKDTGYDDFMWSGCAVKTDADYEFVLQETPVLDTEIIEPFKMVEDEHRTLYAFPGEIAADILIKANGTSGKKLVVRAGEELDPDGNVRYKTRANCVNEDTYIVNGGSVELETYDYLAFRYVEVETDDGVTVESLKARARYYPCDYNACTLETGDEVLRNVFNLCKYTMKYAVQEGYLDCPGREKGQYSGDLAVTSLSHMYITGDPRLLRKALEDWMRSAFIAPALMAVFPAALNQEIADYSFLFPMTALRYYEHTGDREFLARCLETSENILAVYKKYAREDGLICNVTEAWNLVDWPKNLRDDYDFEVDRPIKEGCHNVINALYIGAVTGTEKMRELLGIKGVNESSALAKAFDAAFFNTETGVYVDAVGSNHSSVHSNIFPLFFGFAEKKFEASIADFLEKKGMCCGVYMAFFYLKALANAGRYDCVYSKLVSEDEHSWGNMLKEGATTLFEAWGREQKWNTSLCHPWASCPVSVLTEDILGITPGVVRGDKWVCHLPENVKEMTFKVPVAGRVCLFRRDEYGTTLSVK